MQILSLTDQGSSVQLSLQELIVINNSLNEVCNGLRIPEFSTRIGETKEAVEKLLAEFGAQIDEINRKQSPSARPTNTR